MASRSLQDLTTECRNRALTTLRACKNRGVEVLIYCTYRSPEEQEYLYSLGRTRPGRKVTWARAYESWHQFGMAFDAVPLQAGKPVWNYSPHEPRWSVLAEEGKRAGLDWAGDWPRDKREYVHFQYTGGLTLEQAREQAKRAA